MKASLSWHGFLLILTLSSVMLSCSPIEPTPFRLKIMSYNLHHGEGMDGQIDLERIAALIKDEGPDLVALQEVDKGTQRAGGVDQLAELARLTGMSPIFGPSIPFDGGEYGNAILTKVPVRRYLLDPLPGKERRSLLLMAGEMAFQPYSFFVTHLALDSISRRASISMIEKRAAESPDIPVILAGDLNLEPHSPEMGLLKRSWEVAGDTLGLLTYPADTPSQQIDYILFRPAERWRVLSVQVLPDSIGSDHRPIVASLEYLPPGWKQKSVDSTATLPE